MGDEISNGGGGGSGGDNSAGAAVALACGGDTCCTLVVEHYRHVEYTFVDGSHFRGYMIDGKVRKNNNI